LNTIDDRIEMTQVKKILEQFDAQYMENEISQNGTASEFWNELNGPKQTVSVDEFIRWVFTETRG
jgi:hypothetical protein